MYLIHLITKTPQPTETYIEIVMDTAFLTALCGNWSPSCFNLNVSDTPESEGSMVDLKQWFANPPNHHLLWKSQEVSICLVAHMRIDLSNIDIFILCAYSHMRITFMNYLCIVEVDVYSSYAYAR